MNQQKQYQLSFKVGNKGDVSVYGLQRFPVTLYPEQWIALMCDAEKLRAFIAENLQLCRDRQANPLPSYDRYSRF